MRRGCGWFSAGLAKGCALAVLLFMSGCGSLNEVSGTVSYKGKKLTMGKVTFLSADGKKSPFTNIAADGTYSLIEPPLGTVKVAVEVKPLPKTPPEKKETKIAIGDTPPPKIEPVTIPADYANPGKSGLTTEIKSGKNKYDIDLK